jgi:hypothetical protein
MANTNDAFRGMNGEERLFKSKAELKAEKDAARAKKKLEKSKVRQPLAAAGAAVAMHSLVEPMRYVCSLVLLSAMLS